MKFFIIECLDCEINLRLEELFEGNYCPKCHRSNLVGFEVEE